MQLSVVVIGRNEEKVLRRCFGSVKKMNYPEEIELIYVDSDSSDASVEIAKECGADVIELENGKLSAARARNAGWKRAKGEIILFLDGDVEIEPDFVQEALPWFQDPSIAVVWGYRREVEPTASVYQRVADIEWVYPEGFDLYCGGDALIRKSALEVIGGYDDQLIAGEEPEMCWRLRNKGYKIKYLYRLMIKHDLQMYCFSNYWKRVMRSGYAYAEISRRFAKTSDPLWLDHSRRNILKVSLLFISLFLSIFWPVILPVLCFFIAFLVIRTAVRIHPFTRDWKNSLLYGIHSHFVHLPLFFGQLSYYFKGPRRP